MLARVRTPARARADVNRATTAAKARTLARARAAAQPTARRCPSNTRRIGDRSKYQRSGVEGRHAMFGPRHFSASSFRFIERSGECLRIALTATQITESGSVCAPALLPHSYAQARGGLVRNHIRKFHD